MTDKTDFKKRLEVFREAKWVNKRIKRLAPWPGPKRATIRKLITPSKDLYYIDDPNDSDIDKAWRYLKTLSDKQRQKMWDHLFPHLAPHLERAWVDTPQRPYQQGSTRLPFRAPRHATTKAYTRTRFFLLVCLTLQGFDPDAEWLAAWAAHLPASYLDPNTTGWILSSVLRGGGNDADAVRSVLIDSINGTHEVGQMGRHAVVALLNSDKREDWEIIGKLLLAAQRQEGLRQVILEEVDEANPGAFRYMLGVVLEHDLGRFSATVKAFDTWLGMAWAGGSAKVVHEGVHRLITYFDDDAERERIIREGEPEDVYLALWVTAYQDAEQAVSLAAPLLADPTPERRFVALRTIEQLALFPESAELIALRFMSGAEDDARLQMAFMGFFSRLHWLAVSQELFSKTAQFFNSLPEKKKILKPIVWPWAKYTLDRQIVATALKEMSMGSPEKLIPFVPSLPTDACLYILETLAGIDASRYLRVGKPRKRRKLTSEARRLLLDLMGDTRRDVQKAAFKAIATLPVEEDEVERLLSLLHRNAPAVRSGAIERLEKLPDTRIIEIIHELLSNDHINKRAAGLELASHLIESNRSVPKVHDAVASYRAVLAEPKLSKFADRLLGNEIEAVTLDDCLGLVPPGSRSVLPQPKYTGIRLETDAAKECLRQLAALFIKHGDTEIVVEGYNSRERVLLASAGGRIPEPKSGVDPRADAQEHLPLVDIWLEWLANRSDKTRDQDGMELVRAWSWVQRGDSYLDILPAVFRKHRTWELLYGFARLPEWLLRLSGTTGGDQFLVQYVEDGLAKNTFSREEQREQAQPRRFMRTGYLGLRLKVAENYCVRRPDDFREEYRARLAVWSMLAFEQGLKGCEQGPSLELFVAAYNTGMLKAADLIWLLLHPRKHEEFYPETIFFGPIREVSGLRGAKAFAEFPELCKTVEFMRDRMIEVELTRGERMTPASLPCVQLRHAGGAETLLKLVQAMGPQSFVRHYEWGDPTRAYSFSRLISITSPAETDTHKKFDQLYRNLDIKPTRLLEVAMFAPQWVEHVQHALGIERLADAVWWIHAHTKEKDRWHDQEFREVWEARISERTELQAEDLEEGAVDVAWFRRILDVVGPEGWEKLQQPAKYASHGGGHKRAQLFADAMLGRITVDQLMARINEKRHQDAVRALGLVPLPKAGREAKAETLRRYKRIQEFKRESRKFGSQRQASEGRAVEIGMQNLARTAGYRDPRRLQWAMEAEAVADLAQGPVKVAVDEVTVSLEITGQGDPEFTVMKQGRLLKAIPAKLRKNEQTMELRERITDLRRQRSRMCLSLEESMCRGDGFTGAELQELLRHPMLRPMVERLVFINQGAWAGYPDKEGKVLRDHAGTWEVIAKQDNLRIAHPVDFLTRKDWSAWQRDCFSAERVQPFKQIFREVYPKTASELTQSNFSQRYAGHQVNPRQALALLKQRQWVAAPEEGVRKTFHDEDTNAQLWFEECFFTPADVEGLTLAGVGFNRRGDTYTQIPIAEVPDRLFSEVMRDLDLVVSVAHAGGVDPEASTSTIEMRATLLAQTCQLLNLKNVKVEGHHAIIDGKRASYSVHLGSATTIILPGRVLVIVAVHSQYRGRLFLPFADDDPKTAEVLTKTLLLARDEEIKDPSILDQIRH